MALWMVRVGRYGEHESRFRADSRVYLTWDELQDGSLAPTKNQDGVMSLLAKVYPDRSPQQNAAWAFQIDRFVHTMKVGDLVAVPLPAASAVLFGRITGGYEFDPSAPSPYRHSRDVEWIGEPRPRTELGEDIKASLSASVTICAISKNNAEQRIRALLKLGSPAPGGAPGGNEGSGDGSPIEDKIDIEERARDEIEALVLARFKGKPMERLVAAILQAQGFETFVSPEGPDGGIDILAAPGALGFGRPRLCVQVKAWEGPVDSATLSQLRGTMAKVNADQGLLVSWGGFKGTVDKDRAGLWFNVRFWNRKDLIDQLLKHYDLLDAAVRAEIPLRQVWVVTGETP